MIYFHSYPALRRSSPTGSNARVIYGCYSQVLAVGEGLPEPRGGWGGWPCRGAGPAGPACAQGPGPGCPAGRELLGRRGPRTPPPPPRQEGSLGALASRLRAWRTPRIHSTNSNGRSVCQRVHGKEKEPDSSGRASAHNRSPGALGEIRAVGAWPGPRPRREVASDPCFW